MKNKKDNVVKILLIVLIVLVLFLIGLLGFKLFLPNNEEKVDNNNEEVSEVSTNDDVLFEDLFAVSVSAYTGNGVLTYYFIEDGKLFEAKQEGVQDFKYPKVVNNVYPTTNVNVKEITGLPKIKRLKGFIGVGSDDSYGLLVVAENGEVYTVNISEFAFGKVSKTQFLDDYKVDDIISYYAVAGCVSDGSAEFKTCGGEYNIIDQDGNKHHYVVNTDGTLEKK